MALRCLDFSLGGPLKNLKQENDMIIFVFWKGFEERRLKLGRPARRLLWQGRVETMGKWGVVAAGIERRGLIRRQHRGCPSLASWRQGRRKSQNESMCLSWATRWMVLLRKWEMVRLGGRGEGDEEFHLGQVALEVPAGHPSKDDQHAA